MVSLNLLHVRFLSTVIRSVLVNIDSNSCLRIRITRKRQTLALHPTTTHTQICLHCPPSSPMASDSRHFLPFANLPSRIFRSASGLNLTVANSAAIRAMNNSVNSADAITALPLTAPVDNGQVHPAEDVRVDGGGSVFNVSTTAIIEPKEPSVKKKRGVWRRFASKVKKIFSRKKKTVIQEQPYVMQISGPTDFRHQSTQGVHGLRNSRGRLPSLEEGATQSQQQLLPAATIAGDASGSH